MKPPRHKRATITHQFDEQAITRSLIDHAAQMIEQYAQMAASSDPILRKKGREQIREVATLAIAGELTLNDQRKRAKNARASFHDDRDEGTSIAALVRQGLHNDPDAETEALWCWLIGELDDRLMNPHEKGRTGDPAKSRAIRHDEGEIAFETFRVTVSKQRRKLSS